MSAEPRDTLEQEARDMLYRMGFERAHELSAGDVVELANLLDEVRRLRGTAMRRAVLTFPHPTPGGA